MGRYAQLVLGPAGSGKSTFCSQLADHCKAVKRKIHFANLDPAAERFDYPLSLDIRDLISVEDVQEELKLGPNGALVYAMEYFEEHIDDWFAEVFEESSPIGKRKRNIEKSTKYPAVLFTTSTRDDRVHPGHARKMMALMKAQGHDVTYYENIEGGHGGAANNKQRAYMQSLAYSYLRERLFPSK